MTTLKKDPCLDKSLSTGFLRLQDGSEFKGTSFGALKPIAGELVFNTGMVGYPESLSVTNLVIASCFQGVLCFVCNTTSFL